MTHDVFIPLQALKGRGVAHRQPHRFERDQRAAFDDGWGTLDAAADEGAAPPASAEELRQRVTELEAENERLRQQVKALQDLLAEQG